MVSVFRKLTKNYATLFYYEVKIKYNDFMHAKLEKFRIKGSTIT